MSRGRLLERLYGLELPSQIKAVGLTRHNGQAAFLVVTDTSGDAASRDAASRDAAGAVTAQAAELFPELGDVPVVTREVPGRLRAAAYLPGAQADALTPEQEVLEPVVLGAQVQNGSADERLGGYGVGTLGAFAQDAAGRTVLVSNNHVIAAENDAVVGDEIFQAQRGRGRVVGTLAVWVPITVDRPNRVDIASAVVNETPFENAFLPLRNRPTPQGTAAPRVGTRVFKVGRTSGLTTGRITAVEARVPNVGYGVGAAAFGGSLIIEGQGGSGIYDLRGRLVDFLYAGDGTITLACPAREALRVLELRPL